MLKSVDLRPNHGDADRWMLAISTNTTPIEIPKRTKDAHCNFTLGSVAELLFATRMQKATFTNLIRIITYQHELSTKLCNAGVLRVLTITRIASVRLRVILCTRMC